MGEIEPSTLLSRKRSSLDKLLRERDGFKKAYVARMEEYKSSIGSLRAEIQRLEDGDELDDEEETTPSTLVEESTAGKKATPVAHVKAGDSANDEVEDKEERGFRLPTRGMVADTLQSIVRSPMNLLRGRRSSSSSDDEEDEVPHLAVRGMVADSAEASTGLNENARPVPPGFEARAHANNRARNGTADASGGRASRDLSPSEKSDQSSPIARKAPATEPSLLPRPLRHKTARPVQQIYVPPRNRLSNGGQKSSVEKEERPRSAQSPIGQRISVESRGEGRRQAAAAGQADESSGEPHMDRENFFPTLNGHAAPASSSLRSADESLAKRVPVSQRLSNLNPTEGRRDGIREERSTSIVSTPQSGNSPSSLTAPHNKYPPQWSALVGDRTDSATPGSAKIREWDIDKLNDPQAAAQEDPIWNTPPTLTGHWADTEVNELSGPALKGAWGQGNARDRIRDSSSMTRLGAVPARLGTVSGPIADDGNVIAREREAGLRHPKDETSDASRKQQMKSNRNLVYLDYVKSREVNILEGLELHHPVLDGSEQDIMKRAIENWLQMGLNNELRGRTFSAPRKWAKGKGRITIQFGCCYNYAVDRQGRAPGIIAEEVVEAMPPELTALARRLVRWGIIPRSMEPDSAIVNIYEVEDCIPPHIDHHDFSRPFCTISLLSEEAIMFGQRLVPKGPGEFYGEHNRHTTISLPTGSCLVLNGNGADLAMHCVPPVRRKRMSITLRRMGVAHAQRVNAQIARSKVNFDAFHQHTDPDPEPERPSEGKSVNIMDLVKWKSGSKQT